MFFKKKKEKVSKIAAPIGWKQDEDGNYRIDFDALNAMMTPEPPKPNPGATLERLYVISRDNIQLLDAQNIVLHAASTVQNGGLLISREVPLVWCAAYPDELFGEVSLPELLLAYANGQEGEKYLNEKSKVMPVEGKHNGYEYYLLALVR
ncbi:MAG TPA: hypothetical protein PKA81_09085 [Clostridia bacterium]|nr:hypothetical protein [Clostridia bacterium]